MASRMYEDRNPASWPHDWS